MKHRASRLITVFTVVLLLLALGSLASGDTVGTAEVKEYKGTVSFRYGGGFFLKTDSGEEYKLVMGPPWYIENLGLELKNGDNITVNGIAEEGILFAGTIKKGAKTYDIADLTDFDKYPGRFHCRMYGPQSRWEKYGPWAGPGRRGDYGPWKGPRAE